MVAVVRGVLHIGTIEDALDDARAGLVAQPQLVPHDAALLDDVRLGDRGRVGPLGEDVEGGLDGTGLGGDDVELVDRLVVGGVGVGVRSELHAEVSQCLDDLVAGVILGAVEHHVLEEVSHAEVRSRLVHGPGIHRQAQRQVAAGFLVVPEVIGEAVGERPDAHVRINRQQRSLSSRGFLNRLLLDGLFRNGLLDKLFRNGLPLDRLLLGRLFRDGLLGDGLFRDGLRFRRRSRCRLGRRRGRFRDGLRWRRLRGGFRGGLGRWLRGGLRWRRLRSGLGRWLRRRFDGCRRRGRRGRGVLGIIARAGRCNQHRTENHENESPHGEPSTIVSATGPRTRSNPRSVAAEAYPATSQPLTSFNQ